MTDDDGRKPAVDSLDDGHPGAYLPPTVQRLGTLEELTLGESSGPADGFGGNDFSVTH